MPSASKPCSSRMPKQVLPQNADSTCFMQITSLLTAPFLSFVLFAFLLLVSFLFLRSLLFILLSDMTSSGYNYQSYMHAALACTAAGIHMLISQAGCKWVLSLFIFKTQQTTFNIPCTVLQTTNLLFEGESEPVVAVGTCQSFGEDYPGTGRVLFFQITRKPAEGSEAEEQWATNMIYSRYTATPTMQGQLQICPSSMAMLCVDHALCAITQRCSISITVMLWRLHVCWQVLVPCPT